jgi:hypothetical protein
MLSGVLHSERAVKVNIEIMRAFVRMRAIALRIRDFARRLDQLEAHYDGQFKVVFDAIRRLMARRRRRGRVIGFRPSTSRDVGSGRYFLPPPPVLFATPIGERGSPNSGISVPGGPPASAAL